jgi:Tudor domain
MRYRFKRSGITTETDVAAFKFKRDPSIIEIKFLDLSGTQNKLQLSPAVYRALKSRQILSRMPIPVISEDRAQIWVVEHNYGDLNNTGTYRLPTLNTIEVRKCVLPLPSTKSMKGFVRYFADNETFCFEPTEESRTLSGGTARSFTDDNQILNDLLTTAVIDPLTVDTMTPGGLIIVKAEGEYKRALVVAAVGNDQVKVEMIDIGGVFIVAIGDVYTLSNVDVKREILKFPLQVFPCKFHNIRCLRNLELIRQNIRKQRR